jgi:hypothetical protein
MRINLAKIAPLALVGVVFGGVWLSNQGGDDAPADVYPTGRQATAANAHLDRVATQLAQPGLYVDPEVVASGRLDAAEVAEIDEAAAGADGPVRIAVLPAEKLYADDTGLSAGKLDLAYSPDELTAQLYDRVGQDGTYALLIDARDESAGRSFTAYQWAEDGPSYDVEGALDEAVDCCAPDYGEMLETFTAEAGDEKVNLLRWLLYAAGGLAATVAGWFGFKGFKRRRQRREADERTVTTLRGPLDEEVIALSGQVSALPPYSGDPQAELARRQLRVLDLVEQARHRLDAMTTTADAEAVTGRLGDARYELVAIDALRRGRPVPEPTAPCFFDPRHGPSVDQHDYQPQGGTTRPVPVCMTCRALLEASQEPEARMLPTPDGGLKPYWDLDEGGDAYVDGYWRRRSFPVPRRSQERAKARAAADRGEGFTFVWESDSDRGDDRGSGGGWGGGSGRSRSRSSRTRSFGGGRSRRSSRRSGGSRGF